MYPHWPRCIFCDDYALDGHLTCGRLECSESDARDTQGRVQVRSWPKPRVSNPDFLSEELADWKREQ